MTRKALEDMDSPEDTEGLGDIDHDGLNDGLDFEDPGDGEAEQTAAAPKVKRFARPLTAAQMVFVQGIVRGLSQRAAYREAYPNDTSNDQVVRNSASKLMRHPVVSQTIRDSWGDTVEALSDDVIATKRYVLKQLLAMSKSAKQEGSRLKALELMARSAGMFRDLPVEEAPAPSASQLKRELAGHLKLLGGK